MYLCPLIEQLINLNICFIVLFLSRSYERTPRKTCSHFVYESVFVFLLTSPWSLHCSVVLTVFSFLKEDVSTWKTSGPSIKSLCFPLLPVLFISSQLKKESIAKASLTNFLWDLFSGLLIINLGWKTPRYSFRAWLLVNWFVSSKFHRSPLTCIGQLIYFDSSVWKKVFNTLRTEIYFTYLSSKTILGFWSRSVLSYFRSSSYYLLIWSSCLSGEHYW